MLDNKKSKNSKLYSIYKAEFTKARKVFYDSGVSLLDIEKAFTYFPKSKSNIKQKEKKLIIFKRGFDYFVKSFRLWKTLMKTDKTNTILKAAYNIIFFSYLNGKTDL